MLTANRDKHSVTQSRLLDLFLNPQDPVHKNNPSASVANVRVYLKNVAWACAPHSACTANRI